MPNDWHRSAGFSGDFIIALFTGSFWADIFVQSRGVGPPAGLRACAHSNGAGPHSSFVIQILGVRILGRALVGAQVVLAGRLPVLVAQDLADVADRAAVKKQPGGNGVTQHVGGDLLPDPRFLAEANGTT